MERSRYRSGVLPLEPFESVSVPAGWKGIGVRAGRVSVPFQEGYHGSVSPETLG